MYKYVLFLILIFSFNVNSQNVNCKKFHTGKFELNSKVSGKTEIVRTKNVQIETNNTINVKTQYDVLWINDCTYELRNRKLLSGISNYVSEPTDVIIVQILKTEGNKIFVRTSANFTDQSFDSIIDFIK